MDRLPDFIIIGAMKCATSTLHDQLAAQNGIFMSTPKEPNFFSDEQQWRKGFQWYKSLFQHASANDICGESSTHYTKLPDYPETAHRIHRYLPEIKLIYVMRHPLDRLISQYIHEWTEYTIKLPINEAVKQHPRLVEYGLYSKQLQPYLKIYGQSNVLPVFFERLIADPKSELQRVCNFIGYQSIPVWQSDLDKRNVSSQRLRKNKLRDALVWNPASTWLRRRLVPQICRDLVKGFWQMKERPELSADICSYLKARFDQDLMMLGQWFNIELSCDNFKAVVSEESFNWFP